MKLRCCSSPPGMDTRHLFSVAYPILLEYSTMMTPVVVVIAVEQVARDRVRDTVGATCGRVMRSTTSPSQSVIRAISCNTQIKTFKVAPSMERRNRNREGNIKIKNRHRTSSHHLLQHLASALHDLVAPTHTFFLDPIPELDSFPTFVELFQIVILSYFSAWCGAVRCEDVWLCTP